MFITLESSSGADACELIVGGRNPSLLHNFMQSVLTP